MYPKQVLKKKQPSQKRVKNKSTIFDTFLIQI